MIHRSYMRRLRARWALSQEELGHLLNLDQGRISRYESGEDHPTLNLVFGLQVIFGRAPRTFFPAIYSAVEEMVIGQAAALDRALAKKKDGLSIRKRQLLQGMMERATSRENP